MAGLFAGLGLAWAQSLGWRLAFGWDKVWGLRIGAFSLLPALLGFAWPLALRFKLPSPHDFPLRNLEILLAAQILLPLGMSLVLGLLGLGLGRSIEAMNPRSLALRLGALAWLAYVLAGAWVGQWNNTGDAPHYVLMAHSLVRDGNLDMDDEHKKREWRRFYDREELQRQVPDQADGRQVPEHKPGISALIAPAYALLGISGARWTLGLLAALGGALFFLLCLGLGYSRRQALVCWALFSFSAPWLTHSQIALAELPGGLMLLVLLLAWRGLIPRIWGPLSIAALFWLSVRFFPLACFLAVMDAFQRRKEGWKSMAQPLGLAALSLGLALAYNLMLFGHLSPAKAYEQREMDMGTLMQPWMIPKFLSGLLIDQEFGSLHYTPLFLLSFFGLRALWQRERALFWQTLLPALVYLGPVASFPWWGSAMAPNRFLTCMTPFFMLWALEAWRAWNLRLSFRIFAALSLGWGLLMTVLPWFCFSKGMGQNWILRILGSALKMDLAAWFPTFFAYRPNSWFWVGALATGLLWAFVVLDEPKLPKAGPSLGGSGLPGGKARARAKAGTRRSRA